MAEVYVVVAGTAPSQHRWHEDLLSKFYPVWKDGKIKKDKEGNFIFRRLIVSPIQVYKIATNKENIPDLMNIIGTNDYVLKRYGILSKIAKMIRKVLGLKSLPKPTDINPLYQPNQVDKAVAVTPIGLKEDLYDDDGEEMI